MALKILLGSGKPSWKRLKTSRLRRKTVRCSRSGEAARSPRCAASPLRRHAPRRSAPRPVFALQVFALQVFAPQVFALQVFALQVFALQVFALQVLALQVLALRR